jgi:hypothetical protein
MPQPPQLPSSLVVSTQEPKQFAWLGEQPVEPGSQ